MATCSMRLSRGAQRTVVAGPQKDMLRSIGLILELSAPLRPCASWIVAEENCARRRTASASGRSMLVFTWITEFSFTWWGLAEGPDGLVDGCDGLFDDIEAGGVGDAEIRAQSIGRALDDGDGGCLQKVEREVLVVGDDLP